MTPLQMEKGKIFSEGVSRNFYLKRTVNKMTRRYKKIIKPRK